ncbi:hypothetical protein BKA93DRAFT_829025 [Sparassis latifolia]
MHPSAPIFRFALFNTPAFHRFVSEAMPAIREAEEQARVAYQNLPEHLITSLRGATTGVLMEQKRQHEENNRQMADMSERMVKMEGMIGMLVNSRNTHKSRPAAAFVGPDPSPTTSAPAAPVAAPLTVAPPVIMINFHGSDGPGGSAVTPAVPSITASVTELPSSSVSLLANATSPGSTGSAAPTSLVVPGLVPPIAVPAYMGSRSAR